MSNRIRSRIALIGVISAGMLVALRGDARAQDVSCKPTETQPECHARLKCKANEELEDCQKRLRRTDTTDGDRDRDRERGSDHDGTERGRDSGRDRERGDDDASDDGGGSRRQRGRRERDGGGRHRRGRHAGKGFQANKVFGLGLELGEPSGLTGKYFVSDSGALDFGVGWIYSHYYYGDGFHLYGDYLWHPTSLVSADAFELPFYVGAGLRYWSFDFCDRGVCTYGGSAIGIRVPVGIAFDFNNVPLDIFVQLVPVLDFVNGDYYDRYNNREHFGVDVSAGIRFWFK